MPPSEVRTSIRPGEARTPIRPSFDEYVAARGGALLRFAYLICGDRYLAEDLVQEVLVRAHRRWTAIEADNPDAYLKQAIVHAHVSWRRRRSSSEIATDTLPEAADAKRLDEAYAVRDEMWALLGTLPRAQRAVLVLRYYEDLDDARIAELVGVSRSTVRVHAHRGLHSLREVLASKADEAPTGTRMLENVHRDASRAATRRRSVVAGGLAAVATALVLILASLLRPILPAPIGHSPSVTPSPTPPPASSDSPSPVPTTLAASGFPYAFGFVPPSVGATHVGSAYIDLSGISLRAPTLYFSDASSSFGAGGDGRPALSVEMSPESILVPTDSGGEYLTAQVNGQPASMRLTPGEGDRINIDLEWRYDDLWFLAGTDGTVSADDLRRFAESMTSVQRVGPIDDVAAAAFPDGYVVSTRSHNAVCADQDALYKSVCIYAYAGFTFAGTAEQLPGVRSLAVDGDPAYVIRPQDDGRTRVSMIVPRSDGHLVMISVTGDDLTDEQLVDIYHGL